MACRDRHTSKVNAPREINIKKRVSERKGSIKQTNQTMNILTLVTSKLFNTLTKIPGHANDCAITIESDQSATFSISFGGLSYIECVNITAVTFYSRVICPIHNRLVIENLCRLPLKRGIKSKQS